MLNDEQTPFKRWNEATGVFEKGTGYYAEILGVIEDEKCEAVLKMYHYYDKSYDVRAVQGGLSDEETYKRLMEILETESEVDNEKEK